MPPLKTNWIFRLIILLTLTTLACQLGSDVEVIPTPVVVREVEPVERPSAREETQPADPAPTAAPVVTEPESAARTMQDLQNATVQIFARTDGKILWTGSGTIISPDGLILTNAHVASPTSSGLAAFYNDPEFLYTEQPEELVVALVEAADRPPVESYLAEVRAADGALDLAVIQIVAAVAGTAVDPADLDLPYLEMGDSDTVQLGDEVRVLGFPGAGGDTITFTRGDVSGFESQEPIGFRAWIKTDTTVSPGNSGGLGANAVGEVIGVPSFVIEAMGGAINRLRSINLAQPLVEAARSGETYISPYVVTGTGEEAFTLVTWALDFYEDTSCPIDPVTRYGSGSVAAIAIFEYAGMRDGEQVVLDWFIGDDLLFTHIITWEYGESGDCFAAWIHNYGDPIEDGTYTVELYAGDEVDFIASADVVVGGASSTASTTTTTPAGNVQVEGRITDADTGRPISDATLFILYPDVDLDAWLDNPTEEDIFTYAEVNPRGEYELPDLLQRGIAYPGVAAAEGYRATDGYLMVEEDDPNPLILDLELTK
jgi:putative serine protease PepD